jgi:hypothetical protein
MKKCLVLSPGKEMYKVDIDILLYQKLKKLSESLRNPSKGNEEGWHGSTGL